MASSSESRPEDYGKRMERRRQAREAYPKECKRIGIPVSWASYKIFARRGEGYFQAAQLLKQWHLTDIFEIGKLYFGILVWVQWMSELYGMCEVTPDRFRKFCKNAMVWHIVKEFGWEFLCRDIEVIKGYVRTREETEDPRPFLARLCDQYEVDPRAREASTLPPLTPEPESIPSELESGESAPVPIPT